MTPQKRNGLGKWGVFFYWLLQCFTTFTTWMICEIRNSAKGWPSKATQHDGIFPDINHQAIGYPPWLWKPPSSSTSGYLWNYEYLSILWIWFTIYSGWWFGTFFIFPNSWDDDPIWLYFLGGLKPPTSITFTMNIWIWMGLKMWDPQCHVKALHSADRRAGYRGREKIAVQGDTTDGSCMMGISWEQTGINVQYGNIVGYDGIYIYKLMWYLGFSNSGLDTPKRKLW